MLRAEARKFQKGCWTHFRASVRRIKQNGQLVPRNRIGQIEALVDKLSLENMEPSDFDATVAEFYAAFEDLGDWISWWLRPSIAGMIFPSKKIMSDELSDKLPRTSNPVETQHSLLHHGAGKNHDSLRGFDAIHLHAEAMRRSYEAIICMLLYSILFPYFLN